MFTYAKRDSDCFHDLRPGPFTWSTGGLPARSRQWFRCLDFKGPDETEIRRSSSQHVDTFLVWNRNRRDSPIFTALPLSMFRSC